MVMIQTPTRPITLAEFLTQAASGERCELIDGKTIFKMSPQRFHSRTQRALLHILEDWGETQGEVGLEWATLLKRRGQDWVPIPDLLFVYQTRLPSDLGDAPCPVPPDLAIEIISPGQSFGDMAEKATDYLAAGVAMVWVVDPQAQSITVFLPQAVPVTYRGDTPLMLKNLPHLTITANQTFGNAGLMD
ncbi:MAG: Uma2 family endonuclease [Cyanobacteria bacterium P01_G01_bin.54]